MRKILAVLLLAGGIISITTCKAEGSGGNVALILIFTTAFVIGLFKMTDYPDLNLDDSEHIMDYTYQYQYCLNISYNADGTPGLGSAIFLHCLGDRKPYTGGCVAIPMEQMYFVMQHVSPDCVVVIDTLENLGGSF